MVHTLHKDFESGDGFFLGPIRVTVVEKTGRKTRLKIESDQRVGLFQRGAEVPMPNDGDQHGTHSANNE